MNFCFDGLVPLLKRALRLLKRSPKLSYTDPVFQQNGFLKLNFNVILEKFNFIQNSLDHYNIIELSPRSTLHNNNTRFNSDKHLTSVRTNVSAEIVLYKRGNFYIILLNEIKCISVYENFRPRMKSFLRNVQKNINCS